MSLLRRAKMLLVGLLTVLTVGLVQPTTASAATWAACHANYAYEQTKLVRNFAVSPTPSQQMFASSAQLRCGTSGKGYRHIRDRHAGDWLNVAFMTQYHNDWRSLADMAIAHTLLYPTRGVAYNATNKTVAYHSVVHVRDSAGRLVRTKNVRVVVSTTSLEIITAFPEG